MSLVAWQSRVTAWWLDSPELQLGGLTVQSYSLVAWQSRVTAWWLDSPELQLGGLTVQSYSLVAWQSRVTAWWLDSPELQLGGSTVLSYSLVARQSRVTAAAYTGMVMMEHHAMDTHLFGARDMFASCLEDFGWTVVDRPVRRNFDTLVRGSRLSSSSMVAMWPDCAKRHAVICQEVLLFHFNFTGRFSSGKEHTTDCCSVSGLFLCTQVSSHVTMSQKWWDLPQSSLWAFGCTSPRCPLLLFTQVMGYPMGTTLPCTKTIMENANDTSRWTLYDILYFSVGHLWVLLNKDYL